ncbi:hypothetical protein J7T55_004261 [Diaporthe amygdali]|uniref:uncharacterized protein n=1 Tax=Phomopsis amygdali TaxID=1214568 RepID=UPI0022FF1B16|nr:uncharacterized protein J7T55_004261 [Diaporthe amygdali]KAJ0100750.1 hypothetical protein J7T55_004261 [Diaporthe amygdali]
MRLLPLENFDPERSLSPAQGPQSCSSQSSDLSENSSRCSPLGLTDETSQRPTPRADTDEEIVSDSEDSQVPVSTTANMLVEADAHEPDKELELDSDIENSQVPTWRQKGI